MTTHLFKTITGSVMAQIVTTRNEALQQCMATNMPVAFPDRNLHCYRVITPGSVDDFTAVRISHDSHTSDFVRAL